MESKRIQFRKPSDYKVFSWDNKLGRSPPYIREWKPSVQTCSTSWNYSPRRWQPIRSFLLLLLDLSQDSLPNPVFLHRRDTRETPEVADPFCPHVHWYSSSNPHHSRLNDPESLTSLPCCPDGLESGLLLSGMPTHPNARPSPSFPRP